MNSDFCIEPLYTPAGEGAGAVEDDRYFLSMTDDSAAFLEWSAGGGYGRRRQRVFNGDLWVWPPGQTWWTRLETAKRCVQLSLSVRWLERMTHTPFELAPQVQLQDELLTKLLRTLAQTVTLPQNPTTKLYQESLTTTLALHLRTYYNDAQVDRKTQSGKPFSSAQLKRLSDYIAEHLAETVSLSDLADLVGFSASQFSLRFRVTTGQTPHRFITSVRVERARDLLLAGRHTPAEVAALTGFADQSHLTRHVHRKLGVTPGTLIKSAIKSATKPVLN